MRPRVVDEVQAAMGVSPLKGVLASMEASEFSFTLLLHGQVAAVWGAQPVQAGGPVFIEGALAWLLSSTVVDCHKRAYLKATRAMVDALLMMYPAIFNYVDARYEEAIRWARWLGFSVGPPEPYGVSRLPFHPIILRRQPCA
jgi:hypothetical protein